MKEVAYGSHTASKISFVYFWKTVPFLMILKLTMFLLEKHAILPKTVSTKIFHILQALIPLVFACIL